ncbi:MAG TPA: hypothetical protein VH482_29550 [Thermomicrobiales bacterium]|jgi:hypothetical protein
MGLVRVVCCAVVIAWIAGLCQANRTSAATPPLAESKACSGKPCGVPKPADLPLRVPWKAGEKYAFGDWSYNGDNTLQSKIGHGYDHNCNSGGPQDCYALDFVDMTASTRIFPAFAGTVAFAGCATASSSDASDGWWHYGQIVYIERDLHGHRYSAIYTHLSGLSKEVETAFHNQTTIGVNTSIGTAGQTVTATDDNHLTTGRNGPDCVAKDLGMGEYPHLHLAIYQDADFCYPESMTGKDHCGGKVGPHGGMAVIPEPFIGSEAYENFQWWHPKDKSKAMVATDLADGTGTPTGGWKGQLAKPDQDPTPVPSGQPIKLQVSVKDPGAGLKEVHFTAYYPDWNVPDKDHFPNFDARRVWRIVAICRPKGSPSPSECTWDGNARSATVSYDWNASKEKSPTDSLVDWLPQSVPLAKSGRQACVSFDVVSATGTLKLAPGGVKLANCGLDKSSKGSGAPQIVPSGTKTADIQPGPVSSMTDPAMVTEDVAWMPNGLKR